jgi:hypothetical protein
MGTIGIGCTSYKRPEMLKKFLDNLLGNSSYKYQLHIAQDTDEDRRGVAYRKNECLRALQYCDHVFLFDDDCYPIKKGWEEFFIDSKEDHLLFLAPSHNCVGNTGNTGIKYYYDCGGVFMYMSKKAIQKVGAFTEKFKFYGFEHADYSIRILGKHGYYPSLTNTYEYIYSEDYSNPDHKSSITDEEKNMLFQDNFTKFHEPIKSTYLPL